MNIKKIAIYTAVFLAGVVFAKTVRQVPLLEKLPLF